MTGHKADPLEQMLAHALQKSGIVFIRDRNGENPSGLDFLLPNLGIEIEVKRFHSDRIGEQMSRAENVIALQGEVAVRWFCEILRKSRI